MALLEGGAQAARAFGFTPGVTLSQAQVAQLTQSIVWMEPRVVDGETVLVPVVYVAGKAKASSPDGMQWNPGFVAEPTCPDLDLRPASWLLAGRKRRSAV